jgi:hypothetical protein
MTPAEREGWFMIGATGVALAAGSVCIYWMIHAIDARGGAGDDWQRRQRQQRMWDATR